MALQPKLHFSPSPNSSSYYSLRKRSFPRISSKRFSTSSPSSPPASILFPVYRHYGHTVFWGERKAALRFLRGRKPCTPLGLKLAWPSRSAEVGPPAGFSALDLQPYSFPPSRCPDSKRCCVYAGYGAEQEEALQTYARAVAMAIGGQQTCLDV